MFNQVHFFNSFLKTASFSVFLRFSGINAFSLVIDEVQSGYVAGSVCWSALATAPAETSAEAKEAFNFNNSSSFFY
jgi:hypothetical protein